MSVSLFLTLSGFPIVVLLGEAPYAFYLAHRLALSFFGGGRWGVAVSLTTLAYEVLTLGPILAVVGLHVLVERRARTYLCRMPVRRNDLRGGPRDAPETAGRAVMVSGG